MLIINNEEIESLLTINLALQALERAYVAQANGTAVRNMSQAVNAKPEQFVDLSLLQELEREKFFDKLK